MKLWWMSLWVVTVVSSPLFLYAQVEKAAGVEARITSVTVYEDRALVTRVADLKLEPGQQAVVFRALPAGVIDSSLRASGKGAARVTILGLQAEQEYLAEAKDERVRNLEKEIEGLEGKAIALADDGRALESQLKFVDSIKASVPEEISKEMLLREPRPAEWGQVVEFIGRESGTLSPKIRETQKKARDVKKEIDAAKKKLEQIVSAIPKEQKNVTVLLDVAQGGNFTLDLVSMNYGASWAPYYDIRAERDKGAVELTYCGQVRQNTGEDWKDVDLALSTAKPSVGGRPPELEPWYVSFPKYRPVLAKRAMAPMAAAPLELKEETALAGEAGGLGGGEEEAKVAMAGVERRGEAVTFTVKTKETVPSDNNLHKTTIASFTMKAGYEYLSVPKLAEYAYLMAKAKNEAPFPLLAGGASIFLGPEFVGTSDLTYVAPGEKFDLYLGVDEGIRVKRKLLTTEAERSTVRWKTGWRNYRYRIELDNLKREKETVTVLDQVPVSKEPDITVKLESAKPETVTIPEWEKPGVLCWKLELAPAEKKTIEFEFSVRFPKGKEIEGLE